MDYGNLPTQPLPVLPGPHPESVRPRRTRTLARAGGHVALANVASKVTGFARTLALAAAIGAAAVADSYNLANNMPNMVYELMLGSVFASAIVPLLIRARRLGRRGSREFTQRLLVAAVIVAAAVTVVTVLCAPLLVRILVAHPEQRRLTTIFAYLLLPQIFCYALTMLLTAVLNVRDSFAAAAWAPVVNNVIVLATLGIFVLLPGPVTLTPASMTAAQVLTLGLGTTAGIAGQAAWVAVALRRNGFRWSWRVRPIPHTWRPVRAAVPLLGWVLAYAGISQVGVVVTLRVASDHGGMSVYTYADPLFQVPYGILAASLLTVLMPRISRAAARGDRPAVIADLGRGARYLVVAMVPVTVAMALLGPVLATVVFTGRVDAAAARLIGAAVASAAFGLAPFALVMLQLRVFYADNDTRTPTLINIAMVLTKIGVLALSVTVLPDPGVVVMLGVAGSAAYVVGALTGHLLLRRRYGLLGFATVATTFARVIWAAAIAGWGCLVAMALARHAVADPTLGRVLTVSVGAAIGAATFLLAAKIIGIPEVRHARALLRG
ncbi:murein biosynthesis integral membrane protein MurJ [Nocardia sp. CDC159]|uniref:Murein biosynthesis integral membrane protein MurJ n=1 Tax=Nocardia pulmonis TaxID=2951408 RepID=A0A9X2EE84_9NOCA|nr:MULTISPECIES: murein biosynthesis integral membrane protein MurJ [Nocardia]MCM6778819.1 murein biosynthesis integral membrane protein MurJ [Nocardia pulmonis]MCM6791708.1 murein biosynthesis integral membrane protein MurJ [Nocardia sp. CDC159]